MLLLKPNSIEVLRQCLKKRNSHFLAIVDSEDIINVDSKLGNCLRDIIGDELMENGFNANYEINEYGTVLESIIDEIGHFYM
jgi:hypothetical protein